MVRVQLLLGGYFNAEDRDVPYRAYETWPQCLRDGLSSKIVAWTEIFLLTYLETANEKCSMFMLHNLLNRVVVSDDE